MGFCGVILYHNVGVDLGANEKRRLVAVVICNGMIAPPLVEGGVFSLFGEGLFPGRLMTRKRKRTLDSSMSGNKKCARGGELRSC